MWLPQVGFYRLPARWCNCAYSVDSCCWLAPVYMRTTWGSQFDNITKVLYHHLYKEHLTPYPHGVKKMNFAYTKRGKSNHCPIRPKAETRQTGWTDRQWQGHKFFAELKCLGITQTLRWNCHIANILKKAKIASGFCSRTLWLYNTIVRPIVAYASVIWSAKVSQTTTIALGSLHRIACLLVIGTMSTTPGAVLNDLLNS